MALTPRKWAALVRDYQDEIKERNEWMDLHFAGMRAFMVNSQRKKGSPPVEVDKLRLFGREPEKEMGWEEQLKMLMAYSNAQDKRLKKDKSSN